MFFSFSLSLESISRLGEGEEQVVTLSLAGCGGPMQQVLTSPALHKLRVVVHASLETGGSEIQGHCRLNSDSETS